MKFSYFYDPAAASVTALNALFNTPTKTAGIYVFSEWAIVWQGATAATQNFKGILVKQNRKAERGSPLITDGEIQVTRKPTLV